MFGFACLASRTESRCEAYRNSDEYQQDLADQREAEMREREMGSPNTYERDMM